jgi:hypothetical protein
MFEFVVHIKKWLRYPIFVCDLPDTVISFVSSQYSSGSSKRHEENEHQDVCDSAHGNMSTPGFVDED